LVPTSQGNKRTTGSLDTAASPTPAAMASNDVAANCLKPTRPCVMVRTWMPRAQAVMSSGGARSER
jgi:hypothetical protein